MSALWLDPVELERNRFVRFRTDYMFDRFIDLPRERHCKILDFGCGSGHSIEALLERFPNATFLGVDINPDVISTFVAQLGDHRRVMAMQLASPLALDDIGCEFDVIQLNAVFEHLLPGERWQVMPLLWRRLAVNGYLVITETPWRWFPIETHTTSLPLVNYMPDRLALMAARHCGRYPKTLTWEAALRAGLRGATVGEIISSLRAADGTVRHAQGIKDDARDILEVWWHGECRRTRQKAFAYRLLAALRQVTGFVVSPWVNIVLQKTADRSDEAL
jgi:SAM-dependent methyltransferase